MMTKPNEEPDLGRRNFLRNLAGVAGVTAAAAVPGAKKTEEPPSVPLQTIQVNPPTISPLDGKLDPLERMRADLARAMEKPQNERRWVMVIDLRKCIGSNACTISCVAENHLPPGVVYRPVIQEEVGTFRSRKGRKGAVTYTTIGEGDYRSRG